MNTQFILVDKPQGCPFLYYDDTGEYCNLSAELSCNDDAKEPPGKCPLRRLKIHVEINDAPRNFIDEDFVR